MERQSGHYWVKKSGSWYVAEYSLEADRFLLPGVLLWYTDSELEIDERRIEREEPMILPDQEGPKQHEVSSWLTSKLFNK